MILGHMDLNQLGSDVISEFRDTQSTQEKVRWSCERLPAVVGDASLLRQVFVNPLSNAVKYSRRNPSPKVAVGALVKEPDEWTIFVRDNGVGFDASKADRLFTSFQRLHSGAEFEGTGIGLANVRRIVLRHGGKVWGESRPDHGATLYLSLPKEEKLAERAASGSN
jgi:light-regulated signal transduction histidine kinase (bacteriophytochrome)